MLRSRRARAGRGLAAASLATFAAAVSHSAADGRPAPLLGVVIALAFAAPVCVLLAGRALSWMRLALAVALSQFVFHALLLIGVGENAGTAVFADDMAAHMQAHGTVIAGAVSARIPMSMPHDSAAMWVAHGFAAAVTILAIGLGERAVRALLGLVGWSFVARLLTWTPARIAFRAPAVIGRVLAAPSPWVSCAVRRRGPPVTA